MRRLYCLNKSAPRRECKENIEFQYITPSSLFIKGEKKSFGLLLSRLLWCISANGRARIYYIKKDGLVAHTSIVVPACKKFPFLEQSDLEIGPCFTDESARGRGYYPQTLDYIIKTNIDTKEFYMIVDDSNTASINGIKKAGFVETNFFIVRQKNGAHQKIEIS